jgi:hypothetical protein
MGSSSPDPSQEKLPPCGDTTRCQNRSESCCLGKGHTIGKPSAHVCNFPGLVFCTQWHQRKGQVKIGVGRVWCQLNGDTAAANRLLMTARITVGLHEAEVCHQVQRIEFDGFGGMEHSLVNCGSHHGDF